MEMATNIGGNFWDRDGAKRKTNRTHCPVLLYGSNLYRLFEICLAHNGVEIVLLLFECYLRKIYGLIRVLTVHIGQNRTLIIHCDFIGWGAASAHYAKVFTFSPRLNYQVPDRWVQLRDFADFRNSI